MSSAKQKTVEISGDWERVADLFLQVLEQPDRERLAFIDRLTAHEPRLREQVLALLRSHKESSSFLEKSPAGSAPPAEFNRRPDALPLGTRLGDFELLSVLGRGAFATVYRAKEISLGRIVALKISRATGSEARTLARLEDDHIVQVFSETVDEARGLRMICMQYVPGITLDALLHRLRERPRPLERGAEILELIGTPEGSEAVTLERKRFAEMSGLQALLHLARQLARALDHAHEKGLLHADVKPANILIHPDGRAYLADFNVARERQPSMDEANPFGGTIEYMAPEQLTLFLSGQAAKITQALTPRSDVFSLGVVLRELFVASGVLETPHPELVRSLKRATEGDVQKRFASCGDFARALDGCRELDAIQRAMPRAGRLMKYANERPLFALTVGGFVIQFAASLVSVAYNSAHIVRHLSPVQQALFEMLLLTYNPFCFVIGTTFWLIGIRPLHRFLNNRNLSSAGSDPRHIRYLRRTVRRIPWWVIAMSTGSWMPGSLLFPLVLSYGAGPLPASVFAHFFLSFSLSCLVAVAYGVLFADILCLRCLYGNFFDPGESIRAVAAQELLPTRRRVRLCQSLVCAVPIVGAIIVVWLGPDASRPETYAGFRGLVTLLLLLGLTGLHFALSTARSITESLDALTGLRQ